MHFQSAVLYFAVITMKSALVIFFLFLNTFTLSVVSQLRIFKYSLCFFVLCVRFFSAQNGSYSAPYRSECVNLHGILFGADGGSHSWDLWSVRRQNFRSAFCSTRGEPLDDRNNRHISHLLSKLAGTILHVGGERLRLRRTNVSPWRYVETFTREWRRKNESVRPGLLLIATKLARKLACEPIEFLLEELPERRKGELEIRTRTAKTFPSLWT